TPPLPALAPAPAAGKPAEPTHATRPPKARKFKSRTSQPQVSDPETIDDPELALAEIRAALALVSSKIKKGKKEIDKGLQEIETLDKMIKKKNEG
ncbi:MAG: hypothetical protein IT260_06040, partial [Saprospiraceae bacterium]|nr:hypothetical protein [Saprospiraceae bacterium]